MIKTYVYNVFLGLDQMTNVILLGDPDESISGRIGRAMASGRPKWFVPTIQRSLDWFALKVFKQPNHCSWSIEDKDLPLDKQLWDWQKPINVDHFTDV